MARSTLQLNTYLGPYYLVKLIAIGGMAEIYLATTKGVGGYEKRLALKVIHPDYADDRRFVQMLVDEAKIAVKLNHPNIAQTFDLGRIGNCYFISMEHVDGADFFQVLKRTSEAGREFPGPAALLVAHEALRGLDHAHKKCDDDGKPLQIIHRDVSPQNMLLSRQGEVKLVDFGIAKAANLSTKTRSGVIKGKLVYMSPEQSWGESVDQRSDIFSAGIVLYEALTGGSLYLEKNPVKLLEMVRQAAIPPPSSRRGSEITPELDAIVMKALSPKPDGRYPGAAEFAEALADYLGRTYPSFSGQDLARVVLGVVGEATEPQPAPPPPAAPPEAPVEQHPESQEMRREDFAVPVNSIIFSAEEMMESQLQLPRLEDLTAGGQAKLVLQEEEGETAWPLSDEFVLGRAGDLRLGDARVSRRHARVYRLDGEFWVEDLKSSNGTYVNDQKIAAATKLAHEDKIRVGPFSMRFDLAQPEHGPTMPHDPVDPTIPPTPKGPGAAGEQPQPPQPVGPGPGAAPAAPPRPGGEPDLPTIGEGADGASLTATLGAQTLSIPVGDHLPLGHNVTLAGLDMAGCAASVILRTGSYWLEPVPGRGQVMYNGQALNAPTRLSTGDIISVGPVELRFHS